MRIRSFGRIYICFRNTIEFIVALLLVVPVAPIVLVCACMIWLTSGGPVFYSQTRLGHNGRKFRMHKLRTMPQNAEAGTGPVWSGPNDPRVSRLGRFLRNTHLDELPQLWNVLCGQMSLIGPRPERPEIAARIEKTLPNYRQRLLVRPGITGLAQMQLPPDSNLAGVRRKLAYDLHYVQHIGPWLDLRICVSTVFSFTSAITDFLSKQLTRGERREAENRVETIPFQDDERCEIGTS